MHHGTCRLLCLAWALAALCATGAAAARTLVVGPGGDAPSLALALRQAADGDTIEILPGEYRGDVASITQFRLTIRGRHPRPVFIADGKHAEGKAIWVVKNGDITIENIEFRGARVPDGNGAGIRFEQGRLTVRRCAFFDNQNGLLTANVDNAELVVEDSEFADAPRNADALHHLLYVGRIARLSVTGSHFRNGYFAHLIKSRAAHNLIAYNWLVDGPDGYAAYEIDLPFGGVAKIIGNVIGQGANTTNPVLVSFGEEGSAWPVNALYMAHNTLISDRRWGAWFMRIARDQLPAGTPVHALNNLTLGAGLFTLGARGEFAGNHHAMSWMLADVAVLDFRVPPGSMLRGRGVEPRLADGTELAPQAEFTMPVGTRPLARPAAWTPGAFQR